MSNKIWNFDILVDDCFVNFNTKKQEINPDHNDRLLSVANGFEDGSWRYRQFKEFVFSNIAETALSAQEREKLIDNDYGRLIEAAKHLRLVDKEQNGKGSEIAEIILYGIMKNHYKALSAIPKIFYKQNDNDNAKGSDSVHIVIDPNGGFQLWLGEAKFYNSLEDARLYEPINSVEQMLRKPIMKKECGIMTNLNELDKQIENQTLLKKIKECFDENTSIDEIKPKLYIPILLLHECQITASTTEMSDEYKNSIISFHRDRAHSFFKKQINKLSSVHKYSEINFHLILFPVPDKTKIVNWFISQAKNLKNDADE